MKDDYRITFIRGATTASGNSAKEIEDAVEELVDELISRNNLIKSNLLSITFTATKDLDACFPASIARKCNGCLLYTSPSPRDGRISGMPSCA